MAEDDAGVGRWREADRSGQPARSGPSAASKWTGAAIVGTLLAAAAIGLGWLAFQLWWATGPRPEFIGVWVGPYDRPEIPPIAWQDADRRALLEDRVFPAARDRAGAEDRQTLEVIRRRLEGLAALRGDEPVVVSISSYAIIDAEGRIRILAADSAPYEANTQLPLSWVLDRMKACPARNRLLVLDIMRGMLDPRDVGGTADGVAELLAREVRDAGDPGLMVVAACGPGEVALGSEELRRSAFGYYFHRALTTEEADSGADGLVSVRELAAYLARGVDAWAVHYRGVRQKPVLLGREDGDFALAPTRRARPAATEPLQKETRPDTGAPVATPEKPGEEAKKAGEGAAKGEPASAYPAWLAEAWGTAGRWWTAGDFRASPRADRRLARELIRAELRWRGGEPEEAVRRDLAAAVDELAAAMKRAEDIPRPPIRSVGQAIAFGRAVDPALSAALAVPIRLRHDLPPDSPDLAKAVKDALAKFQGRSGLDLASALVDASQDEILDAGTLRFLDGLVEQARPVLDPARPSGDVLDLRFLHQLAVRAGAREEWKPDVARLAWRTVLAAEEADCRPEALAWVRGALDEADAALHEARVRLLPVSQAARYASWDQIGSAWDDAWNRYQLVAERQRAIREGQAAASRGLAILVGTIPYLEARPDPDLQAAWLDAASQCGELARRLVPPAEGRPADPGALAALSGLAARLESLTRRLLAPSRPEAVRALVERARSSAAADPSLVTQIDDLLLVPFLAVHDRRALFDAGRALRERLAQSWRPGEPAGPAATAEGAGDPLLERVRQRFDRLAALVELAGDATSARRLDEARPALDGSGPSTGGGSPDAARPWAGLARAEAIARDAFARLIGPDAAPEELDRAGWLAPASMAGLDAWSSAPTHRVRERSALAAWTWLASHYRHEGRDLGELLDPDDALELAARECPTAGRSDPDVALRVEPPASAIRLTPRRPSTAVDLHLLLTGADADAPRKVIVDVLEPADERLRATLPSLGPVDVSTADPTTVPLELRWAEDPSRAGVPPPAGLLVRARLLDGRAFHALVPLAIATADSAPGLALSRVATQCDDTSMDRLRLRPIAGARQPFYAFVKNPSDRTWSVTVDVLEGDAVLGTSGPKPMEVPAHSSMPVAGFGTPARRPGAELREPAGPVRLRLRDASGAVLDEATIRPRIAAPADYLEVTRAQFAPDEPGRPNRLTVGLRPLPTMSGLPCPVVLVLPTDPELFPALHGPPRAGTLSGELRPGKEELTLYAEGLDLGPDGDARGAFSLNVDGVRGALWFRGRFPQVGAVQRAEESRQPRVRFEARTRVEPDRPARLEVVFRVDGEPPGARLDFRVGAYRDGRTTEDFSWTGPARRHHLGFEPGGEGGALLFEAAIEDQRLSRPIPGLVGPRRLQARLLDQAGREVLDSYEVDLVLDDRPPASTAIIVPERIVRGTREVPVRASAEPPPSGIKEVSLIFGPKADFDKAAAENRTFRARPADPDGREWSATLPVPADAPSKLVVTARFTTGVGLSTLTSEEVIVTDPPRPEELKPAEPKPGSIKGDVKEGGRPQPGLAVYLIDPDLPSNDPKRVLARQTTDEKGAFTFDGLKPKAYRVYCRKIDGVNNRSADRSVTVEAGKAATLEMGLTR